MTPMEMGFWFAQGVTVIGCVGVLYMKLRDVEAEVRAVGNFLAVLAKQDKQIPVENPQTLEYLQARDVLIKTFKG